MKTYFRLLSFAKPIGKFAFPYFIFTLLYALFNTLVFSLLMPVLNVLFVQDGVTKANSVTQKPQFDGSFQYFTNLFHFYFDYFTNTNGQKGALIFVAIALVICVLLSNVFRYLSARIMENLRIYTLHNLRKTVF